MLADSALPTVWLLIGNRPGEIAQMRIVASALGWPTVEKRIGTDTLEAPWPDVVMSFGIDLRRSAAIRRASGHHSKIVQFGRSKGLPPADIDLLIGLPQDCLPAAPNLLKLRMSYNRQDPDRARASANRLAPRLHHLPRPWTAVMVGGSSRHFEFDAASAARLGRQASRHAQRGGGSLLVSSSPRTDPASLSSLRQSISVPCDFYEFVRDDAENPLSGYFALADDLIVTGDSSSMLAEAWRTGKPVYVSTVKSKRQWLNPMLRRWVPRAIQDFALARGWTSAPVDLQSWVQARLDDGTFSPLGGEPAAPRYSEANDDELARTIDRIRRLLNRQSDPLPPEQGTGSK